MLDILAAIVDHDKLNVCVCLREHTFHGTPQVIGTVVGRKHNRDERRLLFDAAFG
ncbi:uncharacterized protein METZ01_LOCUS221789 [marine metagenome]|uniref:Uncharacterized protein n=1 Tax=marine metagenome TaxID=408172 RepID=A0A382G2C1_9ZZZZ